MRLPALPFVALLAAGLLAGACGSNVEPSAVEPGPPLASNTIDPAELADGSADSSTETEPGDVVGPCTDALAPFTSLGSGGASSAAETMVATICQSAAAQGVLPLSEDPDTAAATFADLIRQEPEALRPVCRALASDVLEANDAGTEPASYLKTRDRRRFVAETCRFLPDYTQAGGFATAALYTDHPQVAQPFCVVQLLRIYDTQWSEERKAAIPRPLFWLVADRTCRAGIRRDLLDVSNPARIVIEESEAFNDLFSKIYAEESA